MHNLNKSCIFALKTDTTMAKVTNPFFVKGTIPAEYFCDRSEETEKIVRWLTNGNNIVLIASRRIGKTKLIDHCFRQPQISDAYYTIFVDILQTGNLQEMTYELGKAVFNALSSVSSRMRTLFMQTVRSIHGEFGFDPITNLPKFSFSLGHIENPTYTLEEIFQVLEQADKPCVIAIDEFQRIVQYPEDNIEAILRTHIQRLNNCGFIFAGSERHLLGQMFLDQSRPFYDSARILPLERIDRGVYASFAAEHFREFGKQVSEEDVNRVYDLFSGNTYAIQKTMNTAFSLTSDGADCSLPLMRQAIDEILEDNDYEYRNRLTLISPAQKEVLYAIARSGVASQVTSSAFVGKYQLGSTSSVQSAMRKLQAAGWIAEVGDESRKAYQLNDLFLMLWIQKKYGAGYKL